MSYQINFADKINYLFSAKTKPNGAEYTHEELAQAAGLSTAAISKMRNGKIKNPGHRTIAALAAFFGVSPNYFFEVGDPEQYNSERSLNSLIALRASELSPNGQMAILGMLEQILKLEQERVEKGNDS